MKSRREVLQAHYFGLLKKAASWVGMFALLSTMFVSAPASALGAQMGARSVTPGTLKAATSTSYAISFKPSTTNSGATIGSLMIEICDSPLEAACAASASAGVNSNGASAVAATFTSLTGTGCTGGTWAVGAGTGPGASGTSRKLTNSGTAVAPTSSQTCVLTFGAILNPAGNNQHFYLRLTTYGTTTYTSELDFGGFALMTAQDIAVTASVQEALTFCTGATVTGPNCASVGSGSVSLGTGTGCPVLSTANVCTGTSQMAASTNANTGYSITYNGTTFTNSGATDTLTAVGDGGGAGGATSSPGSKQFGLAITTVSGGSGAAATAYGFPSSKYSYVTGSPQVMATASGATAETTFTITYMANVDNTTKPGQYTATLNYVCTGLF